MNDETEVLVERKGVPTRLETPVTSSPEILPTVTRLQVPPLHALQWDNFERLCLRYARSHGAVVRSQLYGVKGQAQHGIDLYVRFADPPRYEAYQCKKIEALTPSVISKAVDKFLKGTWYSRVTAFRIMTSHPIKDAKIAEAIESAAKTLEAENITFEVQRILSAPSPLAWSCSQVAQAYRDSKTTAAPQACISQQHDEQESFRTFNLRGRTRRSCWYGSSHGALRTRSRLDLSLWSPATARRLEPNP